MNTVRDGYSLLADDIQVKGAAQSIFSIYSLSCYFLVALGLSAMYLSDSVHLPWSIFIYHSFPWQFGNPQKHCLSGPKEVRNLQNQVKMIIHQEILSQDN